MTPQQRCEQLAVCCKVFSHETCHLLGMQHCTYYHCLMNGVNHLEECMRQSMTACPVCMRKLIASHASGRGLDVLARESALGAFFEKHGMEDQTNEVKARMAILPLPKMLPAPPQAMAAPKTGPHGSSRTVKSLQEASRAQVRARSTVPLRRAKAS